MTIKQTSNSNDAIHAPIAWRQSDSLLLALLAIAALVTRFWRLGYPAEPVFDEIQFVGQAFAYLRGEQFLDVHPNLPKLLIAAAIEVFGHHPWVWRLPGACLGTALVSITFLLGRELFRSRIAATLSGVFILCDGMFLIHSRLAMLEIFHVTFTAASYLLLFQFLRSRDPSQARRRIIYIGLVSGAALASKLMLPAIAFLLVIGFLIHAIASSTPSNPPARNRRIIGAVILLGSTSSIVYLATFLPNYWLGWWGGFGSLFHYYHEVLWNLGQMAQTTNPFVSPWWSWPLMLRAPLYWQSTGDGGLIATIWEGGNPILWWSSLAALIITVVKEFQRPTLTRSFLLIGYFGYMGALALSTHPFFLYIYMTPIYLQYLMLGVVLSECWSGQSRLWEDAVLICSLTPACLFGLGTSAGVVCLITILAGYAFLTWRFTAGSKFVGLLVVAASIAAVVAFLPLWVGSPLEPASYDARIWLRGSEVVQWM